MRYRLIIISPLLAVFVIGLCMAGIHTVKKRNMRLAEEERIRREEEQARVECEVSIPNSSINGNVGYADIVYKQETDVTSNIYRGKTL